MYLRPLKLSTIIIALMLSVTALILFLTGFIEFPSIHAAVRPVVANPKPAPDPFTDLLAAYRKWDSQIGCTRFREHHQRPILAADESDRGSNRSVSVQVTGGESECGGLRLNHVSVLVKGWTWIPDNLDNLYACRCGLSCLWTKSSVLADRPEALLFETTTPPVVRRTGDPLRVYMDLEAGRKRSGREDLFISYHAGDDVQSTYAGSLFHNGRNYRVSPFKNNDVLLYWSSSRCLPQRNKLATTLLKLLPHHSFGKCLNNMGGSNKALELYPECASDASTVPQWWDHLHCAMSHYKFVLAIENTWTESYVTEKLFYALDAGSVPIYFGAPNVMDFVPPHSIIDGNKFGSVEELANYVKALAEDPVGYAEYHAWRRCGVMGDYVKARAASLDTLPCRLCEAVSRRGGRDG